jgi:hypothetical protein
VTESDASTTVTAFTMPLAQMGSASGTYTIANGGTSAVFSNNNNRYWVARTGQVTYQIHMNGDGGTDGSGAVTALISSPYKLAGVASVTSIAIGTSARRESDLLGLLHRRHGLFRKQHLFRETHRRIQRHLGELLERKSQHRRNHSLHARYCITFSHAHGGARP